MTDPREVPVLQIGRGLRVLGIQMVQHSGEIEEYDFSQAAMTILTGPRNSSKTTTLKVIDYCLGGRGGVVESLGSAIEEKYVLLSLDIAINGVRHRLMRDLGYGLRGRIQIDESQPRPVEAVSDWLLGQLGWPSLSIPLGRNAATATQETPLTFRSLLRHIYRREDSWTDFASKEQEYLRRAVISLFLGFAPQRYLRADFDLGVAERRLAAAEAVLRDVLTSTDESVRAIVGQLGLPPIIDSGGVELVRIELEQRINAAQRQRDLLTDSASHANDGAPGLDPELPVQLELASREASETAERVASLERLIDEYERSLLLIDADAQRLHRLVDAVDVFDELPVRICPACEQVVDPQRSHAHDTCYLCIQPVSGDVRKRRAEREQRALDGERSDLADAVSRTRADLVEARHFEAKASERRAALASALHDSRVTRLAPFVAALEDIAADLGRLGVQSAALPALETILARRTTAEETAELAREEVGRLKELVEADTRAASDTYDRCAAFADQMNVFLARFQGRGWIEGLVTIAGDDLTFYVGTRPWEDNLGAEARVLFFLAYNYAVLQLTALGDRRACPPGLLLLDNPYQQGISAVVVADAISQLAAAADRVGAQVIVTQARRAENISGPHKEIRMPREYVA